MNLTDHIIEKVEKQDLTFVVTNDEHDQDVVIYDNDTLELHCILEVVERTYAQDRYMKLERATYRVKHASDLLRDVYFGEQTEFEHVGDRQSLVYAICSTIMSQVYVSTLDVTHWSIVHYN